MDMELDNMLLGKLALHLRRTCATGAPEILTAASLEYDAKRQINNTKFQFRPAAIVLVETAEQVSEIVKFASKFPAEMVLRVRSGGHDHEGECSGTDTLQIDFSKMSAVLVDRQDWQDGQRLVTIGPGARFQKIKQVLDDHHLGIAHGTCDTVGIAGYTMGGGWGPWTRRYGMGCERLVGATIVLGNGDIRTLGPDAPPGSAEAELLWALRGGGGLSYGIVTELKFAAFPLPENLCSFNLRCQDEWPEREAIDILRCWEDAIRGAQNPQLIGTNMMVVAVNLPDGQDPDPHAVLDCTFNGYFAGTESEARAMVTRYFGPQPKGGLVVQIHRSAGGAPRGVRSGDWQFHGWDRRVPSKVKLLKQRAAGTTEYDPGIHLQVEGPAPRKITSRLVDAEGWNDEGRKALICSLQSPLVPTKAETSVGGTANDYALSTYITIGAITGPFYAAYDEASARPSAFPYKDRPFTIQYQAWWNQYLDGDGLPKTDVTTVEQSVLENRRWINRAEDWIDACRDYRIPNTSGAFISFKDSSVRTETYFGQSYHALVKVKQKHSMDKHLLFRSRKTIL